jgi:UDP-N-acetylglucosamine 2-epimerase (non-hydrolysing)
MSTQIQPETSDQSPMTNNQSPMTRLKVLTVVGTRPEIIRLSRVLVALDKSEAIEHTLVHTGQNYDYELNEVFFEDLELRRPDYFLNAAGKNATETAGQILINIDPVLEEVQPDAFLVLGDTNSCLCAIAAKKRHIPIFHMEAGNRCFDQRVPEESNRKIVDHTADINMTYSDIAREYLLAEGLRPDRIIKTGSPMFEVLNQYRSKVESKKLKVLADLGLKAGKYFVVSAHREENIASEKNFFNLVKILNQVAEDYNMPVIVSTHPRTRNMIAKHKIEFHPNVKLMKPMGLSDYLALQVQAKAVLSDSGTISEESSILNFRALNIREAHERPEAMEEASVMMVGLNPERVMQGLIQLESQAVGERKHSAVSDHPSPDNSRRFNDSTIQQRNFRPVADYSMPNVSDKVVRIILSYTDYIKRVVWGE